MSNGKIIKSTLKQTERGLKSSYSWNFKSYFKSNAFSWRGSKLASKRIKEALSEVSKENKRDQYLAAEGAIYLMSRFWPAFQHIDTSSGQLGSAVFNAIDKLLPIIITAPANLALRQHWLDVLWNVLEHDGVDYTSQIAEFWGELASFQEEASRRADAFASIVNHAWQCGDYIVHYDVAYLSALFFAKRFDELLNVIEKAPSPSWCTRKFGARALALTSPDKAIAYAENTRNIINTNQLSIDLFCEGVLINSGRIDDAYYLYAIKANQGNTYLSWFNSIKKKYSTIKTEKQILSDLIDSGVADQGKWFATANKIKCFDLALELIKDSLTDPRTLNRAAITHLHNNPIYSFDVAWRSLNLIIDGFGYDITTSDLHNAIKVIEQSSKLLNKWAEVKEKLFQIAQNNASSDYAQIITVHASKLI